MADKPGKPGDDKGKKAGSDAPTKKPFPGAAPPFKPKKK